MLPVRMHKRILSRQHNATDSGLNDTTLALDSYTIFSKVTMQFTPHHNHSCCLIVHLHFVQAFPILSLSRRYPAVWLFICILFPWPRGVLCFFFVDPTMNIIMGELLDGESDSKKKYGTKATRIPMLCQVWKQWIQAHPSLFICHVTKLASSN